MKKIQLRPEAELRNKDWRNCRASFFRSGNFFAFHRTIERSSCAALPMNRFSDFERNVIAWIADWLGNKPAQLSPDTCINFDLGVDGAGADKLIGFLAEKSGISFSGFPARDYFGPGLGSAAIVLYPLGPLLRRLSRQNRKKLTIRDMATYMYARSGSEPRASSKVINLDCFSRRLSA